MKIPREFPNLELINEIYNLEDNHIKVIFFYSLRKHMDIDLKNTMLFTTNQNILIDFNKLIMRLIYCQWTVLMSELIENLGILISQDYTQHNEFKPLPILYTSLMQFHYSLSKNCL